MYSNDASRCSFGLTGVRGGSLSPLKRDSFSANTSVGDMGGGQLSKVRLRCLVSMSFFGETEEDSF